MYPGLSAMIRGDRDPKSDLPLSRAVSAASHLDPWRGYPAYHRYAAPSCDVALSMILCDLVSKAVSTVREDFGDNNFGAGEGGRTLDIHVGNVMLYH